MRLPVSVASSFVCFGVALVALASACSSSSSGSGATGGTNDGGPGTTTPTAATPCTKNADCTSKVCNIGTQLCSPATPTDGVLNADETDIDCGGSAAKKCDQSQKCAVGGDCAAGVCTDKGAGLVCQPPSNTDGVKNGNETGIDCGSTGNPTCPDGQGCAVRDDCKNQYCKDSVCTAPTPADGVKDGTETDVDCGGTGNPPCADLLACKIADDCKSSVCTTSVCQIPTSTDKVKNGTETSVDCGGTGNPTCAKVTDTCLVDTDCTSGGCDYTMHCALKRSCKAHYGGDTCGYGGDGSVGAANYQSCCATAPVTPSGGAAVQLGKYQVTAGRFRTFLDSLGGNVRAFVVAQRAANKIPKIPNDANHLVLEAVWDKYLPTSMKGDDNDLTDIDVDNDGNTYGPMYTAANNQVGPTIFKRNSQPTVQGCGYSAPGVHMYWLGAKDYTGDKAEYAQSVYDQKSMQCVTQMMAQAFCLWDGGRLETTAEWAAAWGALAFPWGATPTPKGQGFGTYNACRFPTATDAILRGANPDKCVASLIPGAGTSIEYAVFTGSYEWPGLIDDTNDFSPYIAAPGRTSGRTTGGHADIVGNLLEMTSTMGWNTDPFSANAQWAANGSWEGHGYNARQAFGSYAIMDKYGKQGLRCAYP